MSFFYKTAASLALPVSPTLYTDDDEYVVISTYWPIIHECLYYDILIYQGVHCCTNVCNLQCITDCKGSDTT